MPFITLHMQQIGVLFKIRSDVYRPLTLHTIVQTHVSLEQELRQHHNSMLNDLLLKESSVPQIISSGSNIYVVWQDDTPENLDILFKKGVD